MAASITVTDVNIGDVFRYKRDLPAGPKYKVIDIVTPHNAGEPINDEWGGVVWSVPQKVIETVNLQTLRKHTYDIYSKTQNLLDDLIFIKE